MTQLMKDFSNIRHVDLRTFKKKKRDYMKSKVNKLERNSKNNDFREIYVSINKLLLNYY